MKINLKRPAHIKDNRRKLYAELVKQLVEEFDLESYSTHDWLKTKNGQDHFINWLQTIGYKVNTYVWPNEKEPRSQGLEFIDDDPLFVALKLRHFGEDNN